MSRFQRLDASQTIFDPIQPVIDPRSAPSKLFVRAYAEPKLPNRQQRRAASKKKRRSGSSSKAVFDGTIFVLDTETVSHRLTFGAFEEWRKRVLITRAVFYADSLPLEDPKKFEELRTICDELGVRLVSLESIFQQYIWPLRDRGGTIVCANANYDLSRIASGWHSATKTGRRGTRFCNGISLTHLFTKYNEATETVETVNPVFVRIKRDDRHHVRYDFKHGRILDVVTLAFALTDRSHSLASACAAFGVPFENRPGAHSGEITQPNVAGCLYDVAKTSELLWALAKEYERHPIALAPNKASSGAAIAKSYLDALGLQPRLSLQPTFPKEYLGFAAQAYFGGWVECRIVHTPIPCVYLDFASMYPTVFSLLNLWFDHVIPAMLEPEEIDPAEAQALLDEIAEKPDLLFDKAMWPRLSFFAQVEPNGAILPARVEMPTPYAKSLRNIVVGPVESRIPLWYAGPDLAGAAVQRSRPPRILRAWRLKATGVQESLKSIDFRGEVRINPETDDLFRILIEQRKRESGNPLDDRLRNTGFKVIANSGAYGDFAETNPIDIDPDEKRIPRLVRVYGDRNFTTLVDRPETPGRFCFFPTASLVTAAARLMMNLAFREVAKRGGEVAYCDTDGIVVAATENGGFVACDGGPYRLRGGRRAIRALSWQQVEEIRERFESLNPYRPGTTPLLKLEPENFVQDGSRASLHLYGVSEKVYVLFTVDSSGEPVIKKYSAHALGMYQSPIAGDRSRQWIEHAWKRKISQSLGHAPKPFVWETLPALAQLSLTTWSVIKPYLRNPNIHPFDFLLVASPTQDFRDFAKGYVACCKESRPSCFLFDEPTTWNIQEWHCLRCGTKLQAGFFRSYERVLRATLDGFEVKRLRANGTESQPTTMRGLTISRPIVVETVTRIGKEVIVDPTDTDEGLTAEMLSETRANEYADPEADINRLREHVLERGIRLASRVTGLSRRHLQEFAAGRSTPRRATLARLQRRLPSSAQDH